MSQTQVLEKLKSDNSLNKEKIKNLQLTDGIINNQLQILTKNVSGVKDSVSNSLISLDIGTKPTTTIHEHRYFGIAPTSYETSALLVGGGGAILKQIQLHGFRMLKDGNSHQSVLDAGATHPISNSVQDEVFNLARINLNLEPSYQSYHTSAPNENEFYYIRWLEDSGWGDHWNNTKTPIMYAHTYSKISPGSLLEATSMWRSNTTSPASGHIVSAATPSGPWVIRYSWDHRSSLQVANSVDLYQEIGNLSTKYDHKVFNEDDTIWSVLESLARLI